MILVSNFMVHRALSDKIYLLLGLLSPLIWQNPNIQVIVIHAFPKIYLDIKMSDFETNNNNILAGFISVHDKMYVS